MPWVIDTCVLLDVAFKDPEFGVSSALCLERLRSEGLVVCPITLVEAVPQLGGKLQELHEFLKLLGADAGVGWLAADTVSAAEGWHRYVMKKRAGHAGKRPVADMLIGGFACRFAGLVTRNPGDFQPFFPHLHLCQPQA